MIMQVPYINLVAQHTPIKEELVNAFETVLMKGKFILGEEVLELERRFAELCGVKYAVGVNSGTDALILAMRALDIGPGDEVITTPNSFIATTSSILIVGARPVFVDVGDDYNIDPDKIERVITPRTKAIIPVHLTGRPCEMEAILEIARRHDLLVIEDAAQAVMAEYNGRRVGSFGSVGCFSFHPLKTLNACGDGGIVTTDDEAIAEKIKLMRNIGLRTRDNCTIWSGNSRLDTLQAALILVKLDHLKDWTDARRCNADFYRKHLAHISQITSPTERPCERAVYHTFIVQAERRNDLREYLKEVGVGTNVHYPIPIHLQDVASGMGHRAGDFPIAERQSNKILSLPVYPELKEEELHYVVDSIEKFYKRGV